MSRFNKALIVAASFTVLMPAAVGGILTATAGGESADEPQMQLATAAPAKPIQLSTLGRASAVAFIGAGHVSAP